MSARLAIVPLGLSLGVFGVITYVLRVLFGIFVPDRGPGNAPVADPVAFFSTRTT